MRHGMIIRCRHAVRLVFLREHLPKRRAAIRRVDRFQTRVRIAKECQFTGRQSNPCRRPHGMLLTKRTRVDKVIGGELIHDVNDGGTGFAEVMVAGVIIGFTDRPGSTTKRDAEYPHYAFFIEPQDFLPMVAWLRHNGVTTSEPWTRDGIKGLLYFRDPSGNLFEMYCPKLKESASFVRGAKQGGSYEIDFAGLNYEWNG